LPDGVEPADLVTKLQSNGDIEFGELNLRDMDPEEIRVQKKKNFFEKINFGIWFLGGIKTFIYIIACFKNENNEKR
jgi:hypothetical protein